MQGVIPLKTGPLTVNPAQIRSVRVMVRLTRESGIHYEQRLCSLMAVPGCIGIGRCDWGVVTIFYTAKQYNDMVSRLIQAGRRDALKQMRADLFMGFHHVWNNMLDEKGDRRP